jgi:type VI secretion system secreted protein Hcp
VWPRRVRFDELVSQARALTAGSTSPNSERALLEILQQAYLAGVVELHVQGAPNGNHGHTRLAYSRRASISRTNKASPRLLVACASGQHFKSARLTGRASQKISVDFLTVSFTDVLIASYEVGASSNEEPIDQFSINFATISMQYKEQRPDGTFETVHGGWDVRSNKQI